MEEKGNGAKKKAFGVRYGVAEQTDSGSLLCPPAQNRKGGGQRGARCLSPVVTSPWTPPSNALPGGKEVRGTEGTRSVWALHGGVGLSLRSERWRGRQGRKGGSSGTFPPAGAEARRDRVRARGGGCSQHWSCWFRPILFTLRAFSSTRGWVSKRYQPCTILPPLLSS